MIYVVIILLFASLVILHELGHFWAARRGGVLVEEFGVGFPPLAWGKKIKGTLYSINWLPLGGFVRLKGEDGTTKGKDSFLSAPIGTKSKILLAGVGMNFLTAVVLLYGLAVTGMPGLGQFEPTFLHPAYAQPKQLVVVDVVKGSPAEQAGIRKGDLLLQANDAKPATETELANFTKAHAGQRVTLSVQTGQAMVRTLDVQLRPAASAGGYLGVGAQPIYKLRYNPLSALVAAVWTTGALFVATIVGVVQLVVGIPALLIGLFQPTVPAAAEQASGPLGIVFIFQSVSTLGPAYVVLFLANIAVALAAFNVLPLPALDGGRLALVWWQKLTGRVLTPELEAQIHGYGFLALLGLMLVVTVYDIRKFF
ncbi:MAG TPA: site-2 protease family protein [Candidatus Saccharimonadia bacterium]